MNKEKNGSDVPGPLYPALVSRKQKPKLGGVRENFPHLQSSLPSQGEQIQVAPRGPPLDIPKSSQHAGRQENGQKTIGPHWV